MLRPFHAPALVTHALVVVSRRELDIGRVIAIRCLPAPASPANCAFVCLLVAQSVNPVFISFPFPLERPEERKTETDRGGQGSRDQTLINRQLQTS
ncbi:hypothetical protein CGCSCA1_v006019 [Colletotrichum siamense]|nr:hypothetical protein CGCSCA1_v006019 [Colletotrichum siamense]